MKHLKLSIILLGLTLSLSIVNLPQVIQYEVSSSLTPYFVLPEIIDK